MNNVKAVRTQGNKNFPGDGVFCVYQLEDKDGLPFYVGQTRNLRERVYQHLNKGRKAITVSFDVVEEHQMNNHEARKIFNINPKMNRTLPVNDFYKSKAKIKNELIEMVTELVNEIDCDFEIIEAKNLTQKYISTWKYLCIKDCFNDAKSEIKKTIT